MEVLRLCLGAALLLAACGKGGPYSGEALAHAVGEAVKAKNFDQFSALVCWDGISEKDRGMTKVLFTGLTERKVSRATVMDKRRLNNPQKYNLELDGYVKVEFEGESSYTVLPFGKKEGAYLLILASAK